MGIDPGSTDLGLAVVGVSDTFEVETIITKNITSREVMSKYKNRSMSDTTGEDRMVCICSVINQYLIHYPPMLIGIESSFYNKRFPNAYKSLLMQMRYITKEIRGIFTDVPILTFAPMEIKFRVKAKNTKKPAMLAALKKMKLGTILDLDSLTEHEVDAVCVALCVVYDYGRNVWTR